MKRGVPKCQGSFMMGPSDKSARILGELKAFMAEHIYPNEVAHQEALASADNRLSLIHI